MKTWNIFLIAFTLIFVVSCKEAKQKKAPKPITVSVTSPLKQDVPLYSEFVGQVYGLDDIPVRARVEGFLESMHFEEGGQVKKGQLLYKIDPQPFLANVAEKESNLVEAKTELVRAKNELDRIKPLADMNAVSKTDLDASIAAYGAAKANVEASNANLKLSQIQLGYCNIYSPLTGLIGKTMVRVGEFVGKTVTLNTVSTIENVRVQFSLTESEYLKIAKEILNTPEFERKKDEILELILSDGSIHLSKGRIDFVNRQVDASTGSIMLQATFLNKRGLLRPGQFARVRANTMVEKDAILIPQKAIVELQSIYTVTLLTKDNKAKKVNIKVGEKYGDYWIVKEGISKDDKIIYEGFQKVKNGMPVTPEMKQFESRANVVSSK